MLMNQSERSPSGRLPDALSTQGRDPIFLVYNQIVASLPFGREVQPAFSDSDITSRRRTLENMGTNGVAAAYPDYYGISTIRFNSHDEPVTSLPEGVRAIPKSKWGEWRVVHSGVDVYAEPATTDRLEPTAVLYPADTVIDELHAKLKQDLSREDVVQTLLLLGQLPFGAAGVRSMERDAIKNLDIEATVVEGHSEPDGRYLVVHPPQKEVALDRCLGEKNRQKLLTAQARGQINSVRFNSDGSYAPVGMTHELRYDRGGIPRVQVKWMRRHLT